VAAILLVLALGVAANAATIRAIGVLGNSGEAGEGLVRVGGFPLDHCASGVAMDQDWTLWLSGGDAINRLGLDGRLIEQFPLEPAGASVDSRTFAVLDNTLYFLGRLPRRRVALFELPMRSGSRARPLPLSLPERKRGHVAYCLAPQPLAGRLVIAAEPKEAPQDIVGVYFLDPKARKLKQAFALRGSYPHGVAVDARRQVIYLGAHLGLFVGGQTHSNVYAITALRPDGTRVSEAFPVACPKTPAIPTQFRGVVSLAGGALWDTAWYGFLARLDLEGRGAPGRIVEWHHELDYPTQVLGLKNDTSGGAAPLLIATPMPDAFYFVAWDRPKRRLEFIRRIGCLPTMSSVGLSDDGWVTVGTARAHLWWRWEDAADAPPRKAELHIPVTPLFFEGERAFALAAQYRLTRNRGKPPVPTVFTHRLGGRNEARRVQGASPLKQPVGLSVRVAPGKHSAALFVADAATKQVWRTDLWLANLQPNAKKWRPIRIEGDALEAPTDIAALTDGRLLVADGSRIVLLEPHGDRYRVAWQLDRWGDGPKQRFGQRLRFAVDGAWMLVSDTERHRLVWLDWAERKVLGQLGEADKAGDDPRHLSQPTLVALRASRAVVADAGNQRILKLALVP